MSSEDSEPRSVTLFRQYLRIRTLHPKPEYDEAISFLKKIANEIGLPTKVITVVPEKPILLVTWEGLEPKQPAVLLNSHTDVVPVEEEHWLFDPFKGHKTESGDIYGRGAQDMKCVSIQYLEAIRKLKADGFQPRRTIHLTFVPDEEIGGKLGLETFILTEEWRALNIGFSLDEGLASPTEIMTVFYGERCPWWIKVTCNGNPGHGSRFVENTAAEKLRKVVNQALDYRQSEKDRLDTNPCFTLGDVTTLNLTMIEGGVQHNVVPSKMMATFDIRVTPSEDLGKFEEKLKGWCKEAGDGVTYEYIQKFECQDVTASTKDDKWWSAFSGTLEKLNIQYKKEIFPAATDSRFLRQIGIPALGFSPMSNTPILLHDHNEFLNESVFVRGIDVYCHLIPALTNVQ